MGALREEMALVLDPKIRKQCNRAIIITGVARSGKGIVGRIIHSMEHIEHVFEPPILFSLIPLIERMDMESWTLLYETYLYEEFLFNALAGRGLNCNRADLSSIFAVKDEVWIQERLSRSLRKKDAEEQLSVSRIVYNMPDIVSFIPKIQEYYPGTQVIMMIRNANDVFHSILERGWFSDEALRSQNLIWPNHFVNGMRIPYWVSAADYDHWLHSDELHRTAYYYIRAHENMEKIRNLHIVRYDELLLDAQRVIRDLAAALSLQYGSMTQSLIIQVKKTEKDRRSNYVQELAAPIRERVMSVASG